MQSPPVSLKAVGLRLLAQREHSVAELRRKLLRRAHSAAPTPALAEVARSAADEVEEALVWLLANNHLSDDRFAESRVHGRSARHGNLRIRSELAQHGVRLAPEVEADLAASELERAFAVWQRKYGMAPADARERSRQARFLAGRGFTSHVIGKLLRRCATPDEGAND